MSRIVVVGGVAAGMSAASQAKRRQPEAEVVALERGPYVSYAARGMPYNIEDPARTLEELDLSYAPPFAPVHDPVLIAATVARKRLHAVRRREAAAVGRQAP